MSRNTRKRRYEHFFADGKNYTVSTGLYSTKQEALRIQETYKLAKWLIAKIYVYDVAGKKKVELICFEDN